MSLQRPELSDDIQQLWKLHLITAQRHAQALAEQVEHMALSTAWFDSNDGSGLWHFEALFDYIPEKDWLEELTSNTTYELKLVPQDNWIAQNQAAFPPLEIGRFYIHGSHIVPPKLMNKIVFEIDAATAFGTGEHATTQGCLLLMEYLHQNNHMFKNILDLGCGTGILGMAAQALFIGSHVTLTDNDIEAINVAQSNLNKNHFFGNFDVLLSEGFNDAMLQQKAPFDLIIANILAAPLISLAPDITKNCRPSGYIILSGLLNTQVAQIIATYKDNGFTCINEQYSGEWAALLFKKI